MTGWTLADAASQAGRTAVVTGPGGLGFETALALARLGAAVVLAGRSPAKGAAAVANIQAAVPGAQIRFEPLDLASLASVSALGSRLADQTAALDLLINNAGIMAPLTRQSTSDGFEVQFGVNFLGHFALTANLAPLLQAGQARVVNVSSIAHKTGAIRFDDLQSVQAYRPWKAYSQSKLAVLMFAFELQRRSVVNSWGFTSNAAHPGYARTELIANGLGDVHPLAKLARVAERLASQSAAQGALPILFAAVSPRAMGGGYYGPDGFMELSGWPRAAKVSSQARDPAIAARLWDVSEQLTSTGFGRLGRDGR